MFADFVKHPAVVTPLVVGDQTVEGVNQYKYLGVIVSKKLTLSLRLM